MKYHVSKQGEDSFLGTAEKPFLTIQHAADIAVPGDHIIVHEGTYREWVDPQNGGINDDCRIVYEAAAGEKVIIKGSERIDFWEYDRNNVWKAVILNEWFQRENPFAKEIGGDWFMEPENYRVHAGDVYLNGESFFEAESLDQVYEPVERRMAVFGVWGGRKEQIWDSKQSLYQWFAVCTNKVTTIYANFHGADPNKELTEVNVRRSCFFPRKTGINYITVRGFEMAQAATTWAPPTAEQTGLIGPNWSKGWIIENNKIHDAKCSGISLGKEGSTGENEFTRWGRKPGYQCQMESVFRAKNIGWSKERIGSHIVRNNIIYNCGQNGIVGHLGCIFSEIYGNEISRIAVKHEFWGHEIAGIKLHAAIDVQIHNNYIHNCTLGTWLDWQAQGTRVSSNIYDQNDRDLMVEVSHGPYLVDNNIFTSPCALESASQGGAYVNNLCCGSFVQWTVPDRATPYHLPHSTEILGTAPIYGMDDRWYQNIFAGDDWDERRYGTDVYDEAPVSIQEYISKVREMGRGDVEMYMKIQQPAYINGNVYLKGAKEFDREKSFYRDPMNPQVSIETRGDGVYLELTLPQGVFSTDTEIITTRKLGMVRIAEERFENPDGSSLSINRDMLGTAFSEKIVPGPLQNLKPGRNIVKIWKN